MRERVGHPQNPLEEEPLHLRHVLQRKEDQQGVLRLVVPPQNRGSAVDLKVAEARLRDPMLDVGYQPVFDKLWNRLRVPRADAPARRWYHAGCKNRVRQLRIGR